MNTFMFFVIVGIVVITFCCLWHMSMAGADGKNKSVEPMFTPLPFTPTDRKSSVRTDSSSSATSFAVYSSYSDSGSSCDSSGSCGSD